VSHACATCSLSLLLHLSEQCGALGLLLMFGTCRESFFTGLMEVEGVIGYAMGCTLERQQKQWL